MWWIWWSISGSGMVLKEAGAYLLALFSQCSWWGVCDAHCIRGETGSAVGGVMGVIRWGGGVVHEEGGRDLVLGDATCTVVSCGC